MARRQRGIRDRYRDGGTKRAAGRRQRDREAEETETRQRQTLRETETEE